VISKTARAVKVHGYEPYAIDEEGNLERTNISFEGHGDFVFKIGSL
jgi:hypothetical protein